MKFKMKKVVTNLGSNKTLSRLLSLAMFIAFLLYVGNVPACLLIAPLLVTVSTWGVEYSAGMSCGCFADKVAYLVAGLCILPEALFQVEMFSSVDYIITSSLYVLLAGRVAQAFCIVRDITHSLYKVKTDNVDLEKAASQELKRFKFYLNNSSLLFIGAYALTVFVYGFNEMGILLLSWMLGGAIAVDILVMNSVYDNVEMYVAVLDEDDDDCENVF